MSELNDPFEVVVVEEELEPFDALKRKPFGSKLPIAVPSAVTARFRGFDQDNRPLVVGLPDLADELVPARTTIALSASQVGSSVVLLFESGDIRRPIIVGVLQEAHSVPMISNSAQKLSVDADDERLVLTADREIVLRCGHASITLTRAGKVLIQGAYVLSRSSGYNKIKGAAVDIN